MIRFQRECQSKLDRDLEAEKKRFKELELSSLRVQMEQE